MYLTSQRVVSPQDGSQGINAFLYHHEPEVFCAAPPHLLLDRSPGLLRLKSIVVHPPGNRVRSYLDIVAPNHAAVIEIRAQLARFVERVSPREPMPWLSSTQDCAIRFMCDQAIAPAWNLELDALGETACALLLSSATDKAA